MILVSLYVFSPSLFRCISIDSPSPTTHMQKNAGYSVQSEKGQVWNGWLSNGLALALREVILLWECSKELASYPVSSKEAWQASHPSIELVVESSLEVVAGAAAAPVSLTMSEEERGKEVLSLRSNGETERQIVELKSTVAKKKRLRPRSFED